MLCRCHISLEMDHRTQAEPKKILELFCAISLFVDKFLPGKTKLSFITFFFWHLYFSERKSNKYYWYQRWSKIWSWSAWLHLAILVYTQKRNKSDRFSFWENCKFVFFFVMKNNKNGWRQQRLIRCLSDKCELVLKLEIKNMTHKKSSWLILIKAHTFCFFWKILTFWQ